jgi:hypothetical protein
MDARNLRAAHGSARPPGGRNPCLVCSEAAGGLVFCNQLRGHGSVQRARRKLGEKIVAAGGNIPDGLAQLLADDGVIVPGWRLPPPAS